MSDLPQSVNPLLQSIKLPGDTVRIPSRGAFYTGNELASHVKNGEVHVYPMRAIDEITMRSPDKLLSGDAVREVFAHCIPDIITVDQLFAKDVDFLMIALRRVTYGAEYEFNHVHDCEDAQKHSYVVDINQFMSATHELDPVHFNSLHNYVVPGTGQIVQFQPLRYSDIIAIMDASVENTTTERKPSLMPTTDKYGKERKFFQSLLATINNVDGISDKDNIVEWLSNLPAPEVRRLIEQLDKLQEWGPKYDTTIKCKDCGADVEISVPVNPLHFFV